MHCQLSCQDMSRIVTKLDYYFSLKRNMIFFTRFGLWAHEPWNRFYWEGICLREVGSAWFNCDLYRQKSLYRIAMQLITPLGWQSSGLLRKPMAWKKLFDSSIQCSAIYKVINLLQNTQNSHPTFCRLNIFTAWWPLAGKTTSWACGF